MSSDLPGDGATDHVDHILAQWAEQRPDLDVWPMGIIGRMSRLSRFLERRVAEVLAGYGLNEPQFAVLAALRRAGPPYRLSPTELYNSLLISSGAVTNRLERLTKAGLVRRVPAPHDGRSLLVELTRKGHRLIDEAVSTHTDNEQRLLASLTVAEQQQFATLLRKLLLEFEDHPQPADGGGASPRPPASAAR